MLGIAAPRDVLLLVCVLAVPAIPARAQETRAPQEVVEPDVVSLPPGVEQVSPPVRSAVAAPEAASVIPPPKRPTALVPLYVSFAGFEALDIQSTYRALRTPGARESNPVTRTIVGSPATLTALKLATTASFVLASEKMWKRHRVAAVVFAAAGNAAMAAIVAHNYRVPGN
jgi:Domain of unknown function (DUF5658)